MDERFYKYPIELMRASGFIAPSGEVVPLTPLAKNVYVYMVCRNHFFVKKLGREHYETQTTIATACDSDYKAVGEIIRRFSQHGLLTGTKTKDKGGQYGRWVYTDVNTNLQLYKLTSEGVKESKILHITDIRTGLLLKSVKKGESLGSVVTEYSPSCVDFDFSLEPPDLSSGVFGDDNPPPICEDDLIGIAFTEEGFDG